MLDNPFGPEALRPGELVTRLDECQRLSVGRDVPNEKRRDQVEGYRKPFRQCFQLGPGIPKLLGWCF